MRYYIADCHFFHAVLNIAMDKRGFDSVEEMNEVMIERWNQKVRKNDEVVAAFFANPKDVLILLQQKGNLKKFKVDEIAKIKRSNVAKSMIPMTKTNPNYVISATIIHKQNLNDSLQSFVIGDKGFAKVDFNSLKSSAPTLGKGANSQTIGKPLKLIISMNNLDLND